MTSSTKNRLFTAAIVSTSLFLISSRVSRAEDPSAYAKMGSPLWTLLSTRLSENTSADLVPFYVFTDGKNLTVIPQAFVANYSVAQENPVKLVVPGPSTVAESDKYPVLTISQFLEKNRNSVNKVTASNPVKSGMLNVYTTNMGTPTTVEHLGKK